MFGRINFRFTSGKALTDNAMIIGQKIFCRSSSDQVIGDWIKTRLLHFGASKEYLDTAIEVSLLNSKRPNLRCAWCRPSQCVEIEKQGNLQRCVLWTKDAPLLGLGLGTNPSLPRPEHLRPRHIYPKKIRKACKDIRCYISITCTNSTIFRKLPSKGKA